MAGQPLLRVSLSFLLTGLIALKVYASSIDSCPGYTASNVQNGNGKITADLSLGGDACNVYGTDLPDLRLLVEYQTSTYRILLREVRLLTCPRTTPPCQNIRCRRARLPSARKCCSSTDGSRSVDSPRL